MKKTTTKKRSALNKLIPATCMLLVSATMVVSSTYAWFTMSREVEVNNIKLVATVPADMQLSLGMLNGITLGQGHGLGDNYGTLAFAGTSADNGGVTDPDETAEYWSNMADVSAYYALGKIMPASSTNGSNVYFTPDSSGVGKTLKSGAKYYKAVEGATKYYDNGTTTASGTHSRETTLHAFTSTEKTGAALSTTDNTLWTDDGSTSHYIAATGWNDTNDDGYYVDIPIWFRTSCKDSGGIGLSVDAYVTTAAKNDTDDLYLAARAVILSSDKTTHNTGLLEIKPDKYDTTDTIVNFMSSTNSAGEAVKVISAEGGTATYNTDPHYKGTADVVTVPAAPSDKTYGDAVKVWVRVWLEGEDPNCWNENAGQDFNISLKFSRDRLYNAADLAASSDSDRPSSANYPTAVTQLVAANGSPAVSVADNAVGSLKIGDTVKLTGTAGILTYTYDGSGWKRGPESFEVPALGTEHKATIGSAANQTFSTDEQLVALLNTNINTKALAQAATATPINVEASNLTKPTEIKATVSGSSVTYSTVSDEIKTGATSYTVNGITYASGDIDAMKTYIATLANGDYIITIEWPAIP